MDAAEKVMIACLLLSEGAQDEAVRGFMEALEEGIRLGEQDSLEMRAAFLERLRGPLPAGPAGSVIRLMRAKIEHDEVCRRFGIVAGGLSKALDVLQQPAGTPLAARILVKRVLAALGEVNAVAGS